MTHGTGCGCPNCMELGGERAFAKVGEPKAPQIFLTMTECERRIAEAIAAEREACAAIAKRCRDDWSTAATEKNLRLAGIAVADEIAAAIRARGETKP